MDQEIEGGSAREGGTYKHQTEGATSWDEDYTHRSLRQIFNFPTSKAAKTKTEAHATRHNLNISLFGAEVFIYDLVGPFTPLRHRP